MTQPYTGGCACGAIRYATRHAPIFQNHCQCRDCQRRSGTGHGSWLTFPARSEMMITGEATHWVAAASLDDPGRFAPQVLTYGARALAWDVADPSLQAFERMPTG